MESSLLGLILDSSVIIDAERKGQTVEDLLEQVRQSAGEVEIAICDLRGHGGGVSAWCLPCEYARTAAAAADVH